MSLQELIDPLAIAYRDGNLEPIQKERTARRLYALFDPRLRAIAYTKYNPAVVEDFVQAAHMQIFTKALPSQGWSVENGGFYLYGLKAARNRMGQLRGSIRYRRFSGIIVTEVPSTDDTEDSYEISEEGTIFDEFMAQQTEKWQAIVHCKLRLDMGQQETADFLSDKFGEEIPIGTVQSSYFRAIKKFRKYCIDKGYVDTLPEKVQ